MTYLSIMTWVILIFSLLPFAFLLYLKKHPEKSKNLLDIRKRPKWLYKLFLGFTGFSICCTYVAVSSIIYGITAEVLPGAFVVGNILGVLFCVWLTHIFSKKINKKSFYVICNMEFFTSVFCALSYLAPVFLVSAPLYFSNIVYLISFSILALASLWLRFHSSKSLESTFDSIEDSESVSSVTSNISSIHNSDEADDSSSKEVSPTVPVLSDADSVNVTRPIDSPILSSEKSNTATAIQLEAPISTAKHSHQPFVKWIVLTSVLFCLLGVVIGYLAGGGYLSPSLVPDSPYIQQLKQAEIDAASKNYDKGYRDGRNEGYASGREYGYEKGYVEGYDGAYDDLALLLDDYLG